MSQPTQYCCPQCGTEVMPGARFCAGCGVAFAPAPTSPQPEAVGPGVVPPPRPSGTSPWLIVGIIGGILAIPLVVIIVVVVGYAIFLKPKAPHPTMGPEDMKMMSEMSGKMMSAPAPPSEGAMPEAATGAPYPGSAPEPSKMMEPMPEAPAEKAMPAEKAEAYPPGGETKAAEGWAPETK